MALKVAELELEGKPALEKALRLLDWMYSDFIVGGPAFLFAALYFAPSALRKGLLKQLHSPNRARAVDGAKNAAWDITYISDFVRRVDDEGSGSKRFILATADKGLARIASALFHYKDEHDDAGSLSQRLEAWWSQADARTIANKFMTTVERLDESTKQTNTCRSSDYIQSLVLAGERYLLESR